MKVSSSCSLSDHGIDGYNKVARIKTTIVVRATVIIGGAPTVDRRRTFVAEKVFDDDMVKMSCDKATTSKKRASKLRSF
ncbi:unnamed protein product [Urochloa humidicola]